MVVIHKNDGKLVVNTKISDKGFKDGYKKLTKETENLLNQYNKQVDSVKKQEMALDKLKGKLKEITSSNKTPTSIKNMETELKRTNKEVESLEKQYNDLISKIENKKADLEFAVGLGNVEDISRIKQEILTLDNDSIGIATELENANDKSNNLNTSIESLKNNLRGTAEAKELTKQISDTELKLEESVKEANSLKDKLKEAMRFKFSNLGGMENIRDNIEKMGNGIDKFKQKMFRLIGTVAIFSVLRKGLNHLVSGFGNLLKSNDTFNNTLNQIKVNLITAFAPIYEYALPAINSLMNILAKVTGSIATFVAGLFGKTASQAKENAKALYGQAQAQKKLNEEQGQLGSFDKLEVVSDNGSKNEGLDFSNSIETDDKTLKFLNNLKDILSSFDTSNLQKSLGNLWESFKPFASNVGDGLKWLFDNVLVPLAQWTISELLPSFFNILAGALDIVNKSIEDIKPIWEWWWNNVVIPLNNFVGGVIVSVLNGIGDALKWISQNEIAMAILEGIAIAIGLVAGALALYNGVMIITNIVTGIFAGIMAVLTSPITLVILAIGVLIGIIILCIKHWEEIKETVGKVWNAIVGWFGNVGNWFKERFDDAVNGIKNAFASIGSFFSDVWHNIQNIFSGVADWFKNIFTTAWNNVKNVFSTGGKIFAGIVDGIANTFKTIVNAIIDGINKVIASPFNTINGMLNTIRNVSFLGLSPFKGLWGQNPLPVPQIPKLATGAVIPPGQEFMAILGDQKHGKNLEAPEELIRKIVREESKNGDKEVILNATFDIRIGDDKIDRVVLKGIRLSEKKLGKPLLVN